MISLTFAFSLICIGFGIAASYNPILTRRGQAYVMFFSFVPLFIWVMIVGYLTIHNYQG